MRRVDGIDALRGFSILAVLLLHVRHYLSASAPKFAEPAIFWNGYNGVIVFFGVSGFLITTTCLRRWGSLRAVPPLAFYRLRFARIVPCLLGVLFLSSALHLLRVPAFRITNTSLPRALFAAGTFHLNWLEAKVGYLPGNWDVLWSLSIEETFYLFFPLLCRSLGQAIVPILLSFIVIGPFARVAFSENEIWADKSWLSCLDAISIGCLAALLAQRVRLRPLLPLLAGAALVLLVMVFRTQTGRLGLYRSGLDVTALALGAALLSIAFAQRDAATSAVLAPLRFCGRNSYEIYLTHMFVIFGCAAAQVPWPFAIALCVAAGALVARFYSEPLNRALRSAPGQLPAANAFGERA